MKLVILGLSITSSWGNGHATTYRGLVRELCARGHSVLFLERDVPWYAANRDLPAPPFGRTELYADRDDLSRRFTDAVRDADFTLVGSYVPEGVPVGEWALRTAAHGPVGFYDIDTPVTLAKLARGDFEYLSPDLIRQYAVYLSFTGGPTLARLQNEWGSPCALPLYCSFDPALYYPDADAAPLYDLGYMGTYSADRQPPLETLLLEPARRLPARRFAIAGPQYPPDILWPLNVTRIEHLPPAEHRAFYTAQRFTLNITRADMRAAGWSPSVRLFEAAACATPIISDAWDGLDAFFTPGREILVARDSDEATRFLIEIGEKQRRAMGEAGRQRVLHAHTAAHRAAELERYILDLRRGGPEKGATIGP
jgi:spore maturation protein CgeB